MQRQPAPPTLFSVLCLHTPHLLCFLLPSDVSILASVSQAFHAFFMGHGPDGGVSIGELWWRDRCLRRLGASVAAIVFSAARGSTSWMELYCRLRRLSTCRVAVRLGVPHATSAETWIVVHNEELEEASLERWFNQSDFYRHQLTTTYVIQVRVSYGVPREGPRPGGLLSLGRRSFVTPPPDLRHPFVQTIAEEQTRPLIRFVRRGGSSVMYQNQDPCTEIVIWQPEEPALLPCTSRLFPPPATSAGLKRIRFQTRLLLPSRAQFILLHNVLLARLTEHPTTARLAVGPRRAMTPQQLIDLSYVFLSHRLRNLSGVDVPGTTQPPDPGDESPRLSTQQVRAICHVADQVLADFQHQPPHTDSTTIKAETGACDDEGSAGFHRFHDLLVRTIKRLGQQHPDTPVTKLCISICATQTEETSSSSSSRSDIRRSPTLSWTSTDKLRRDKLLPVAYSQELFHLVLEGGNDTT